MKSAAFDFELPTQLLQALTLQSQSPHHSKFLGGGQSMGPMLNLRLAQPDQLISLQRLAELKSHRLHDAKLSLGALITHAKIEDKVVPDVTHGLLPFVAANIAYRAIRNQGTLGGSLCHADPAADWVSTMMLLNATLELARLDASGSVQTRQVLASDFMLGAFTTQLQEDEILNRITITAFPVDAQWGYYKICQKPGEFAQSIAAVLQIQSLGLYRMVVGATSSTPLLIDDAKTLLNDCNKNTIQSSLLHHGLEADAFELQNHVVAVARAIQMVNSQDQIQR
jgi:carbon-monoxide dehydrogenase medium subunit